MKISLIAAISENFVIGKDNDLPWKLPKDMKYFMQTTKGHHVIMGRRNYDSIPKKFMPLPDRVNIILTRQKDFLAKDCRVIHDIEEGINFAKRHDETELFIIGGSDIYNLALPFADRLYLTEIAATVEGDRYFPKFDTNVWKKVSSEQHYKDEKHIYDFAFNIYEK